MSRRHALLIGIDDYPGFGPESQLGGAVRDAQMMAEVLIDCHGFEPENVRSLCDAQATRDAILGAMEALCSRAAAGDQVVLCFSGHGSQMTDREGDEGDGLDETLVPSDGGRGNAENRDITDDEINHWAARLLKVTPHLTLIFDCCHSATLQRPTWRVRSVPPDLRPVEALPPSPIRVVRDVEIGPRPLMLAACGDQEQALELPPSIAGEARGALSFHLVTALREASPRQTWRKVFARVASALARDIPEQHPRLSGDGVDAPIFGGRRARGRRSDAGRRLLELAGRPDPFGLTLELFRSRGGAWRRATRAAFIEGDRLRVDLRHAHRRELYVYLLDVGLTGKVTLLFPDSDGQEALDPSVVLTVGARRGDALELFLPEDLPPGSVGGTGHLVLVAAEARLSAAELFSGTFASSSDAATYTVARPYELRRA